MPPEPLPSAPTLRAARDRTIAELCRHFAEDRLDMDEFEHRLDRAHRAGDFGELQRLTADMPPVGSAVNAPSRSGLAATTPAPRAATAPARTRRSPMHQRLIGAVLGGVVRRGAWEPPSSVIAYAFMGGVELDFREARLPPGVTEIKAFAVMGGVEILVPPDLPVEANGFAILGGFEHENPAVVSDPDRPSLRITGLALMGGVDVIVRLPGESEKDAKRRRREEQRRRAYDRRHGPLPAPPEGRKGK